MFRVIKLKNKVFLIIISFLLLVSSNAWSHNPSHSSTMLVEGDNNDWSLIISSSLTAFQREVQKKYSVDGYKTPEEFKELMIKHLSESISIFCDDNSNVSLEKLAIKLGHATKVSFKVIGLPKDFNSITVKNTSFQNLNRNQSALIILKKGVAKEQFVLDKKNKHTLTLNIKDSKFDVALKIKETKSYFLWIFLGVILILTLTFFMFKNKLKTKSI